MFSILRQYTQPRREFQAEERRTQSPLPAPFGFGSKDTGQVRKKKFSRRVKDLIALSESSIPSRAIRLIRNGVSLMDFGIQPRVLDVDARKVKDFARAIEDTRRVLENPNESDDFSSWTGAVVEDLLCFDMGGWEYVPSPINMPGVNDILALYPFPGHTMAEVVEWNGSADDTRWVQVRDSRQEVASTGSNQIPFTHADIEFLMQRKRTFRPFGHSQLETSVDLMEAWLGITEYQAEVASNAYPPIWIYVGETDEVGVQQMRVYWEMDMQGRGTPGIFGNTTGKPEVLELKPQDDAALYLKYQEMLVRSIAYSFDLKPQDFNIERDLNRSTAVVGAAKSVEEARKPIARLLAKRINGRVLPMIAKLTNNPLVNELEFFWGTIDQADDTAIAKIHSDYLDRDVLTIDEVRQDLDMAPLPNGLGKMTMTAFQEFAKLDFGEQLMFDNDQIQKVFEKFAGASDREELSAMLLSDELTASVRDLMGRRHPHLSYRSNRRSRTFSGG